MQLYHCLSTSVSRSVLQPITMQIPKDSLQMPRPLCKFLHVYFLRIQVCNKTISVKKKKKKQKKRNRKKAYVLCQFSLKKRKIPKMSCLKQLGKLMQYNSCGQFFSPLLNIDRIDQLGVVQLHVSSRYKMVVLTRKLYADLAHDKLSCVNTNCLVLEMESDWGSYRGCLCSLNYAHILWKKRITKFLYALLQKVFCWGSTGRNFVLE